MGEGKQGTRKSPKQEVWLLQLIFNCIKKNPTTHFMEPVNNSCELGSTALKTPDIWIIPGSSIPQKGEN